MTVTEQRLIMEQTAIRLSLPMQAVEKDLWVTAMLQIMFGLPCAESLVRPHPTRSAQKMSRKLAN